jgi:flagellar basal-body rod protein FlgF
MIRGLYNAASGMLLGLRQQDVIAENMANASTVGYKAEQSSQSAFGNLLARRIGVGTGPFAGAFTRIIGGLGSGAYIDKTRTSLVQGAERTTASPLDVMVRGDGFFVVQTPDGVRYTRDGHLDRDSQNVLINANGNPVLDVGGQTITLSTDHVRIKPDGGIYNLVPTDVKQSDGSVTREDREEFVAQLQVVTLPVAALVRAGDTQFAVDPGVTPTPVDPAAGTTAVLQGSLEEGNVVVGNTVTQMVSLARTFEASQHVFTTINETLESAVRDVGRV